MVRSIILFAFIFLPFYVFSQQWVEMMEDPTVNFYDVQEEFNEYFERKTYEKGKGWKQFKRWEYFMEPRVYPSGKRFNPEIAWKEHLKFKREYTAKMKKTSSRAATWTPLGPDSWTSTGWNPGIGRVNGIAVDPNNSNVIYIGAPSGGCWKSTDGGASWNTTTDTLPILGVSSIAIDPDNSNTVYIGTGDGDGSDTYSIGVLKSTDGGNSWETTGLNWSTTQARRIYKLIINPVNTSMVIAATGSGIFVSTDGGDTWTSTLSTGVVDVDFKPGDPNVVYASGKKFYKSTDGGATFTEITSGLPFSGVINRAKIAITPANPNYVYFVCGSGSDGSFYGLYRSTDSGDNFTEQATSPNIFSYSSDGSGSGGQSWYDMDIAASLTNADEIYIGGINVWKSTDGGVNYTIVSHWVHPSSIGYTHADIHNLEAFNGSIFCGSDGGIFKTDDNGNSWTDLSTGLKITQFYRMGGSATNPGMVIGGAQDNGTNLRSGGLWTHVIGADGMEALIDYTNADIMYGTSQNGGLRRSTDGGFNFSSITSDITDNGAWVTPFVIHPSDPSTLFAGYENVWKTTDRGDNWTAISTWGSSTYVRSLAISKSNPDYIYAGTYYTLYKTTNGGGSWTDITAGLPSSSITYLAIDPVDPERLWVTFSGFTNGEKVFFTEDGGATWQNISGNLPNLPVNCIAYEEGSPDGLYVGTDVGIYYKDSTLFNWMTFMDGLPNVIVNELEINYSNNKIRAATFGRGMWESNLFSADPSTPVADFTADKREVCPGDSTSFTDLSVNSSPGWEWFFPGGSPATSNDPNPTVFYPTAGSYDVTLIVSNSYGSDTITKPGFIEVTYPQATGVSLVEGFETTNFPEEGWTIDNPDGGITWEKNISTGGYGASASSTSIDNFSTGTTGKKDAIKTAAVDLSTATIASCHFDVAYCRYSASYSDTLAVYYTVDCGATKNLLYRKGGEDLATAPDQTTAFVPDSSQWRTDTIDLSAALGVASVQLIFENESGWGNFLYLDNINISSNGVIEVEPNVIETASFGENIKIYPNPFNDIVKIKFSRAEPSRHRLAVFNILGEMVEERNIDPASDLIEINLDGFPSGIYLFKISNDKHEINARLVKM